VATGLGVFLLICWQAVAAAAVIWILVVAFWRYSSLGSICAAAAMPVLVYLYYSPHLAPATYISLSTMFIAVLIIAKHRGNIERLLAGKEPRLGARP
jgi:glycerol-3-phosphate acyltransferase PlsY